MPGTYSQSLRHEEMLVAGRVILQHAKDPIAQFFVGGEREIPGGLQATTDSNGGGRPDLLIIGIGLAPERSLMND
jgi:hypothetical protein